MKKHILVFASFLFSFSSYAQILISGIIENGDHETLPYANVLVHERMDSTFIKGYVTDEHGTFKIELENGNYFIKCSYIGTESKFIDINQSIDLGKITLNHQQTRMEDIIISATRPLIQREQDRLIVNVENSILSSGTNTIEILQKSPGVIVDHDGNISMNGRNGVRIFIDGRDTRLNGDQLTALLEGMPANSIEKIEIITNPSSKYEAQGNAGIIDIITKKGKLFGTNGNLSFNPGYGRYFRWDNAVSFNHRDEKFNLYGNYSFANRNQYMEIILDRKFLENNAPRALINMNSLFRLPIQTHSPKIGVDFSVSEKTQWGISFSGMANLTGQEAINEIFTKNGNGIFMQFQTTDTKTATRWYQSTVNAHLNHFFANKSKVAIDINAARYNNGSDQEFYSEFFNRDYSLSYQENLVGDIRGYLNLIGGSVDFTLPFQNGSTLESGLKSTKVISENDQLYTSEVDGITTVNEGLTNLFLYDEGIIGAYINWKKSAEKWSANIGLRGEQTFIKGLQRTTGEDFSNQYFQLFPSISANYKLRPDHALGWSISRRLDRPGYNDLNPFRFFVNNYTYRVGNPYLTPQFTWSFEMNYTLKQQYYFAINYGITVDNLNRAIFQEGVEDIVVVKPINIDQVKSLGLTASLPLTFAKWWNSQWNVNTSFNDFNGELAGFELKRINRIIVLNTNHNFNLKKGFRLQLGAFFLPSHYAAISKIENISNISFGIQKTLPNNQGTLRFNFNDIFYNGYPVGFTAFGNLEDGFISKRDTRYATLSYSKNFGKQTVKQQSRRKSSIQEELNRAQQQNEG